jgi:hypothetical protein
MGNCILASFSRVTYLPIRLAPVLRARRALASGLR